MALDISKPYPDAIIYGIDSKWKHVRSTNFKSRWNGSIDNAIRCRFCNVSVPVDVALTVLPQVLDAIGENSIVFEVGSTKAYLWSGSKSS
jgi:prephenate dehydrogenase